MLRLHHIPTEKSPVTADTDHAWVVTLIGDVYNNSLVHYWSYGRISSPVTSVDDSVFLVGPSGGIIHYYDYVNASNSYGLNSPDRRDGNYAYYIHPEGDICMSYVNGYGISYGIYSYPYKGIFSC